MNEQDMPQLKRLMNEEPVDETVAGLEPTFDMLEMYR